MWNYKEIKEEKKKRLIKVKSATVNYFIMEPEIINYQKLTVGILQKHKYYKYLRMLVFFLFMCVSKTNNNILFLTDYTALGEKQMFRSFFSFLPTYITYKKWRIGQLKNEAIYFKKRQAELEISGQINMSYENPIIVCDFSNTQLAARIMEDFYLATGRNRAESLPVFFIKFIHFQTNINFYRSRYFYQFPLVEKIGNIRMLQFLQNFFIFAMVKHGSAAFRKQYATQLMLAKFKVKAIYLDALMNNKINVLGNIRHFIYLIILGYYNKLLQYRRQSVVLKRIVLYFIFKKIVSIKYDFLIKYLQYERIFNKH